MERSVEIGQPIIFAAMNYRSVRRDSPSVFGNVPLMIVACRRLDVFGFLGGKEIKEAGLGNLGLQDRTSDRS